MIAALNQPKIRCMTQRSSFAYALTIARTSVYSETEAHGSQVFNEYLGLDLFGSGVVVWR